jgi:hypothetical protein
MNTLEQRIAAALSDDKITSHDVGHLLIETEQASLDADKAAVLARELALDPIASPDTHKARAAIEDANFICARLRTVMPRLQTKYDKVSRNERHEKWCSEYDRVKIKRDAAAEKLRQLYPEMVAKFVAMLLEIEGVDQEVKQINTAHMPFLTDGYPHDPHHMLLKSVELTARGLDHFGTYDLQIIKDLKMPNFSEPAKQAWPVPKPPIDWSNVTPKFPSKGADWWKVKEEEEARKRVENTRIEAELQQAEGRNRIQPARAGDDRRNRIAHGIIKEK